MTDHADDDRAELLEFLDAVFGDTEGQAHFAFGHNGRFVANPETGVEKYEFSRWEERHHLYPAQAEQLADELLSGAEVSDGFLCYYLMHADKRVAGGVVSRDKIHLDWDGDPSDTADCLARIEDLGGFAIASGSPGHIHGCIPLATDVTAIEHRAMCDALATHLPPGLDTKKSVADVLRAPQTRNHKGRARGGESTTVTWLVRPTGVRMDVDAVRRLLGMNVQAAASGPQDAAGAPKAGPVGSWADAAVSDAQRAVVDKALAVVSRDRSADTQRVIGAVWDAGLRLEHARAAVASRSDLAERLAGRTDDDVLTIWLKLSDERGDRAEHRQRTEHDEFFDAHTGKQAGQRQSAKSGRDLLDERSIDGEELGSKNIPPLKYVVDGMLQAGAGLIVGPPKVGKSFFVANVALAVAQGGKVFDAIPVDRRPVLYFALEDGDRRLQSRFRMILGGKDIPQAMHRVLKATLEEIELMSAQFIEEHPDALVILDTFGKVKPVRKNNQDAYQADYEIGTRLKTIADQSDNACLWIVHHTRKATSDDFIESSSGTLGLPGSLDFTMTIQRSRMSNEAVLSVTGRDIVEGAYAMTVDGGIWSLDGDDLAGAAETITKRAQEKADSRRGDRSKRIEQYVNDEGTVTIETVLYAPELADLKLTRDNVKKILARLASANCGKITSVSLGVYQRKTNAQ